MGVSTDATAVRSFRLDPDSVTDVLDNWPVLLGSALIAGLLFYLGITHAWARYVLVVISGLWIALALRGATAERIREKYPEARFIWLLSAGLTIATLGVATRMLRRETGVSVLDLVWLAPSFALILAFVLINRNNGTIT
jgi:hypothetical protein